VGLRHENIVAFGELAGVRLGEALVAHPCSIWNGRAGDSTLPNLPP
jgi:hypothetical protein